MKGESSIEELLFAVVCGVLEENNIKDNNGLYKRIVMSIWNKESLEEVYSKNIPRKKSAAVWSAISSDVGKISILSGTPDAVLRSELSVMLKRIGVPDTDNLYSRCADKLLAGKSGEVISELSTICNFNVSLFRNNFVISPHLAKDPQEQLVDKIAELLQDYSVDDPESFANTLATGLTTGTPKPEEILDGEVTDDELAEIITKLQEILAAVNLSLPASPLAIETFKMFLLPAQLSLSDFHKVEEFALQNSSTLQMAAEICNNFQDPRHLFSVLFFLTKRSQGLSLLATSLKESFIGQKKDYSEFSLRFFINVLLANCVPFLRHKFLSLLAISNPIPLSEYTLEGGTLTLALIPEPYWVFNNKFVLLSYGLGACKGKSTMLNNIFGTNFEESNGTCYFRGTADMQSDQMFIHPREITVIDAHGILNEQHKRAFLCVADGVVIHVSEQLWKNRAQLRAELEALAPYNLKFVLVLVRDVAAFSKTMSDAAFDTEEQIANLKLSDNLQKLLHVYRFPNTEATNIAHFYANRARAKIWEAISPVIHMLRVEASQNIHTQSQNGGAEGENARQAKSKIYLDQLPESLRAPITAIESGTVALVNMSKGGMGSGCTSLFKIYRTFRQLKRCHNELVRVQDLDNDRHTHLLSEIDKLNTEIRHHDNSDIGEAMSAFERMILSEYNAPILYRFVSQIKTLNSQASAEIRNRLMELKGQVRNAPTDEQQAEIRQLTERLESQTISVEIFWREINQFFLLGRDFEKIFPQLISFTQNSDPFEIVDGDNYYLPHDFLAKAFRSLDKSRILVIGIIGPQNSGKSTLLNFMFGCVFTASDGRTTKGVYGSLIQSPKEEYDYLLLLDTEGIHSVEKNDPEYDRKVVLFTLAVCDVVIINVKDEISDGMRKTLDICASSLTLLEYSKMPKPVVFFVQNQKANVQNIQLSAMQEILTGLHNQGLSEILSLSMETFIALPSAFNTKDITVNEKVKWRTLETSPDFIDAVTNFTDKVFKLEAKRREEVGSKIPFANLPGWIDFAHNIFITVSKYEDLTLFADITERNLNAELQQWQQKKSEDYLSTKCREELKSIAQIEEYINKHVDALLTELDEMRKKKKVPSDLYKRHRSRLITVFMTAQSTWSCDLKILSENKKLEWEIANGSALINKKITEILSMKDQKSETQLQQEFHKVFEQCLGNLRDVKDTLEKSNKEACLSQINTYTIYQKLATNASEDISKFIGRPPQDHVQHILGNVDSVIYSLSTVVCTPDIRLFQSDYIWRFFRAPAMDSLIVAAKSYAAKGFKELPSDFCKQVLTKGNTSAPTNFQKFTSGVRGVWERVALKSTGDSTQEQWAILLTDRVAKDLRNAEVRQLIVDVKVPFDEVEAYTMKNNSSFTSENAQKAVAYLQTVVDYCNGELGAFGARLVGTTVLDIHALMCQLLISASLKLHSTQLNKLVAEFQAKQGDYKSNFLAQTHQGPNMDSKSIGFLARELEQTVLARCLLAAKRKYIDSLNVFEAANTRSVLQAQIEARLASQDPQVEIQYVKDPSKFLHAHFSNNRASFDSKLENDLRDMYKVVADQVEKIANWLASVGAGMTAHEGDFFEAPSGATTIASLSDKQTAAVLLLKDLLCKTPKMEYQPGKIVLKLLANPIHSILATGNPPHLKLPPPDKSDLLELLLLHFGSVHRISNIVQFAFQLKTALASIAAQIANKHPKLPELDTQNCLQMIEGRAIGCTEKCPCCLRCCDMPHWRFQGVTIGEGDNRHKCNGGHQYRGMAGYSLKGSKWASIRTCSDINDSDRLEIDGKLVDWGTFKKQTPSWDFRIDTNIDTGEIANTRAKMVALWQRIGPNICKEHGILFTTQDYALELPKHYIFVLDDSGSMLGAWKSLLEAVQSFVNLKLQSKRPNVDHTVSCIVFAGKARVEFSQRALNVSLFDNISFTGGGTNFGCALREVTKVLDNCTTHSLNVVLFMTDGEAEYPDREINTIRQEPNWGKIDMFWGVLFNNQDTTLQRITQAMGNKGQYRNPQDVKSLVADYIEIAKLS